MTKPFIPLAFLALLASAVPASAAPLRQPVGKWVVDYGETLCSATRTYGDPAKPLTLSFRPSPGGTVVRLALGRSGNAGPPHHFPVQVNGKAIGASGLRFEPAGKGRRHILWIDFERSDLDLIAAAGEIAVAGEGLDERFALPGFAKVLAALDTCNADLRSHWNADEAGEARIAEKAASVKPIASYVSDDDYPPQALMERAGGTTAFVLMIDAAGNAADCMVEQTSGIATLDVMSCAIFLERAKFRPALGPDGKPVRSLLSSKITWRVR
jgi:hypothetical protein